MLFLEAFCIFLSASKCPLMLAYVSWPLYIRSSKQQYITFLALGLVALSLTVALV